MSDPLKMYAIRCERDTPMWWTGSGFSSGNALTNEDEKMARSALMHLRAQDSRHTFRLVEFVEKQP